MTMLISPTTPTSFISYVDGIKQISDNEITVDIQILQKIDANIEIAINQLMNYLYPNIIYTVIQEADTLYVDINVNNAENFTSEVLKVIFRFKTLDQKLINDLLKLDLLKLDLLKTKKNNLLIYLLIVIVIIFIIIYILFKLN